MSGPRNSGRQGKLRKYHIPVDRRLEHTSAWMNMFAGKILPMDLSKELKEEPVPKENCE